jgi:hypothetical protein
MATSDTCACTCMTTDSALSITANAISIVTLAYVVLIGIGYRVAAYQTAKERSSSLYVGTKTLRAHIDGISVSFNTYSEPIMISILNDTRDRLSQLEINLEKGDKSSDKWSMIWRQLRYTRRRDDWERDLDKIKLQVDLYQKYEYAVLLPPTEDKCTDLLGLWLLWSKLGMIQRTQRFGMNAERFERFSFTKHSRCLP